ncbi:MAG TPA: flagellar motor protein MotB [Rhodanobacteraceae bacterium]|nr:flagellar motor protein MotB [Rhodanobacteraceae bacterium]
MKEGHPRIIIRRKGGGHAGHHGGAWKIALADFMTTLMALFLVLWVIATATPEQLRGLADYFSTPLAQAVAGGDRTTSSDSAIPGGGPDHVYNEGERANVHVQAQPRPSEQRERLRHLRDNIMAAVQANKQLRDVRDQLRFEMTPEGLRIQMVDSDRRPMFELGSDKLEPYMRDLLRAMVPFLNELPNQLSIYGYTDDRPYQTGENGYSNWELSAGRANASRRELVADGLDSSKLLTVTGVADRIPLPGAKSSDPANRRIELLVLTSNAAQRITDGAPLSLQQGGEADHELPDAGGAVLATQRAASAAPVVKLKQGR